MVGRACVDINIRSYFLAQDEAERAEARALFDEDRVEILRRLDDYGARLVTDEHDRRMMNEYRRLLEEWLRGADRAFALVEAGRAQEAATLLNGPVNETGIRLSGVSIEWIDYNQTIAQSAGRAAVVVLDLTGVRYLDSSGIRAIDHAFRELRSDDRSLLIVSPPDTAAEWTFRIAGFDPALLVESVDVALSSTGDPQG